MKRGLRFLTGFCLGAFLWLPLALLMPVIAYPQSWNLCEVKIFGLPLEVYMVVQIFFPLVGGILALKTSCLEEAYWSEQTRYRIPYVLALFALFVVGTQNLVNGGLYSSASNIRVSTRSRSYDITGNLPYVLKEEMRKNNEARENFHKDMTNFAIQPLK